ncbi:MAG: hypothetical protein Q4Q13_07120, partial [Vagococcus sp.]|nr:hypothetical protein [Vagococcus sp.]
MFKQEKWQQALQLYKNHFNEAHWQKEKYKWEALKCFQDNWDIEADNFSEILEKALAKTQNLLSSNNNFPRKMIVGLARQETEKVREMFKRLFDEEKNYFERIENFKSTAETLFKKHENLGKNH